MWGLRRLVWLVVLLVALVACGAEAGASPSTSSGGPAAPAGTGPVTGANPTGPAPASLPPASPSAAPFPERPATAGHALRLPPRELTVARPAPPEVASGPTHRVATRVLVPALGIDLPVDRQRYSYPECNVAMYLEQLGQPGQGGPTYLYAHARAGMFLPLLERSWVNNGASMIGMEVIVFTGDNQRFVYRIDQVRRHATDLDAVFARGGETLWLQTSEGPRGTVPKLQVAAGFVSSGPASHAEAHPVPRPVPCG